MPQHQSNFPQLTDLDPILTDIYYQHYGREFGNGGALNVFNIGRSTKSKETDLRIGSFTDPVEHTGKIQYQTVNRGYEIEYVPTPYSSGFIVERELFDDQQYEGFFRSASEMGIAFGRRIRKDAASVFNNAFDASVAGYDGVALCSTLHPRSRTDTTTVSNSYSHALTSNNLETVILGMQGVGDDNGEEIVVMPDTLIVPRALRKTALEIAGSERVPENANNAINVNAGFNVVVDPYLTNSNAWFVVDSSMANQYLKWYNRITAEFNATQDFDTFNRKYSGYMRYSFGWSDWRWVAGSDPS